GEESWYGMGLSLDDVKGIRVISHGGSMFGYKSNFFLVPDAGVGGVILTNADSGWDVTKAIMRRTLEVIYDGKAEAEENLLSAVRETKAYLTGAQRDWKVPPDASEVKRLAASYRNAALGGRAGELATPLGSRRDPRHRRAEDDRPLRAGHPRHRRPHHRRPGARHRLDRRRGPSLARARDRRHRRVVDAAAVLQRPRRRSRGGALHQGHQGRHRRERREGRHHQVRHRHRGRDAGDRKRPARAPARAE